MSFSASWGTDNTQHDVCKTDVVDDLALENGLLSPPLDQLAEDVLAVVEQCATAAREIITNLPDSPSGKFTVYAYGHVRQPDSTVASTTNIQINEKVDAVT